MVLEEGINKIMNKVVLLKMPDDYMFGGNPKSSHWYEKGVDRKGRVYLVATTHLYQPDPNSFLKLNNHIITKVKYGIFDCPTGRSTKRYYVNAQKKPLTNLDINNNSVVRVFTSKKNLIV